MFRNVLCAAIAGLLVLAGLSPVMAATHTYKTRWRDDSRGGAHLSGGFTYNDNTNTVETVNITTEADPAYGLPADTFDNVLGLLTYGPEHQLVAQSTTSSPLNAIVINLGAFLGTQPEYVFTQIPNISYIYVPSTNAYVIVNGKAVEVLPVIDTDGDGVPDDEDAFPNDPTESADTDGDGFGDNSDACVNSDLSPTVGIDGIDTGVTNDLLDDGCTISDLIDIANLVSSNHGQFVSAVAHLTNLLKDEGVITGKEKGAIQKVAAKAFK